MIETLPDMAGCTEPDSFAGPDHPMRKVTRQVAFEGGWDRARAKKVGDLFDGMAAEWSKDHGGPARSAPVADALERGGVDLAGRWLELGSGTGSGTRVLADGGVTSLVACDLSGEMLAHAPSDLAPKVRGDSSMLPFPADRFDAVLLVNMLLFPTEIDRVLAPSGTLVWVNTLGDQTPIYLSTDDVVSALPGEWNATTARAGTGFWATVRRA